MNRSTEKDKLAELHRLAERDFRDARIFPSRQFFQRESAASRRLARQERDIARGYSINVKQVALAFAVEFWIIGLIIVGTYLLVAESGERGHVSNNEVFSALLLPAALSMVELARVPLAIAMRTQKTLHIKLFAGLGVLAAIIDVKRKKDGIQVKITQSQHEIEQKIQDRNAVNDRLMSLQQQLTKVSSSSGMSCKPAFGPDGKVSVGQDGKPLQNCAPAANVNQTQLNLVKTQIANTQKELELAQNAVKQSEDDAKQINSKEIDEQLAQADNE